MEGSWDTDYDSKFVINASTPWEEVTEAEYNFLSANAYYAGFTIFSQLSAEDAKVRVKEYLEEAKKAVAEKQKRQQATKAREAKYKAQAKTRQIEKAKQLLAKEGLIPALDSLGKDH